MEGVEKNAFLMENWPISQKRSEIGPVLLLITHKKWHSGFQETRKSSFLYDLEGH